jgi:hypothetical protein
MSTQPKIDDGGSANDATMRDYFAAFALQGILAQSHTDEDDGTPSIFHEDAADDAYSYADSMLAARKR